MTFIDEARINVYAGSGGNGCVSFRRERNIAFGGPDGGNGGGGGDVVARVDTSVQDLAFFRYRRHFKAGRGGDGAGRLRAGRQGDSVELKVPLGCVVLGEDKKTMLADMDAAPLSVVLCRGGTGGVGNHGFKSSLNRTPRRYTKGTAGETRCLWLRLKVLSDVGLLGMPNAGKSTLLSFISAARPAIAAYPFTTLHPILGVVEHHSERLIFADLPGLVAGADEGVGLGHRFLGHAERCRCFVHLVDGQGEDLETAYDHVMTALSSYGYGLANKAHFLCLSKVDGMTADGMAERSERLQRHSGRAVFPLSAHSGFGIESLLAAVFAHVFSSQAESASSSVQAWQPL